MTNKLNSILIDELSLKDEKVQQLDRLMKEYIDLNEKLEFIESRKKEIGNLILKTNYYKVGNKELNKKITITRNDPKKIIDYDETLKEVPDIQNYKYEVKTLKWNDDKIKEELNVVYKEKETNARILITELEKGE